MFQLLKLSVSFPVYLLSYLTQSLGQERLKKKHLLGKLMKRFCIFMGPLYIKMGQILSTRTDLIGEEIAEELKQLQDDVPPMNDAALERMLTREYHGDIHKVFKTFSKTPIASASIAQVHEAVLHDGQRVAVKIVREGIRDQMERNLGIVRTFIAIGTALHPLLRQLKLKRRFQELSNLLLMQTSMTREAESQRRIYRNFLNHPYVIVPRTIDSLCSDNILVMEFMDGIPGNDHAKVDIPRSQLARRLQDTIYTMLYMDGVSHGDPHPGNIFFTKDGKIILLDFGITSYLTENEKWGLSSFYYAASRKEWPLAVERFTQYFVENKNYIMEHWDDYYRDMEKALRYHFDERTNRWSTISYFEDVNKVLIGYHANYTHAFTKVELVFLSAEGFVTLIDPDIDIWANAQKFTDRYSPYMNTEVKARFDTLFGKLIPTSLKLRDEAKHTLVAPTHLDRYFFPSTYPLFVAKAEGANFIDVDGNHYIDLSCGYGAHILGYAHPEVVPHIVSAVQNGCVNAVGHEPELTLSKMLVDAFPGAERAVFSNSGTEAIIQALRMCRAYTGRQKVVKCEGHYHGFSDNGLVSSWFRFDGDVHHPTPVSACRGQDKNIVENTIVIQYGDPASLDAIIENQDDIACVIIEPLPAMLCRYDEKFLKKLREICTAHDIPLVFDEVVTGFRVHYGGAQIMAGVEPDLTCLGKVIGGGLPAGAVVGKKKVIESAKTTGDPFKDYESKAFVGGTMSGNSISCSAAIAVLTYLKNHPEVYDRLNAMTDDLVANFKKIAQKHNVPMQIKGAGSIFSMSFKHRETDFYRQKVSGSNFKANLALAYYMRLHGVYMPELHTLLLNAQHTFDDLQIVYEGFDKSMGQMVTDGFFEM